jgi:cephalosporin-C deacetylase
MLLQELKEYKGRNPRPADHDSYWEQALAEMHATDPMVELVPHDMNVPYAECFDMYFTGVRGARVHAKYVRPARPRGKHPAVLQFHGYSVNSGEWSEKLKWAALGFSVAALDCRGQGGLSEDTGGVKGTTLRGHIIRGLDDTPDNLLFRHIFLDAAELARIIMDMPDVDPDRVGATGGSQGGGLTIACAALEPCMAVGLMDEICPPSSQFAAYNRMNCQKNLVIYPDFAHESLPGVDDRIYEYLAAL